MTIKPQIAAVLWFSCLYPTLVASKDIALVLPPAEGTAQVYEPAISPATTQWPSVTGQLKEAGFDVLVGDAANMSKLKTSLPEVAEGLGKDTKDRLIIIADASFIADTPSGWLFFGPGDEVFVSELDEKALRLSDLNGLSQQAKGPVIVIVATRKGTVSEANRLRPVNTKSKGSNVIYVSIGADAVSRFLQNGLLREGVSFSDLESVLPAQASIDGYLTRDRGFMGPVSTTPSTAAGDDIAKAEEKIWQSALQIGTKDAMELYLSVYPEGVHVETANQRIAELNQRVDGEAAQKADRPTPDLQRLKNDEPPKAVDQDVARTEEEALELTLDQRIAIQEHLDILGMDPGIIDGSWGEETRAAIRDWQLWSEFPVTGYVSAKQIGLMRTQADKQLEREKEDAIAEERIDREYWQATGQRGSEQELHAYLARFPDGLFADLAYQRLAILEESIQQMQRSKMTKGAAPAKAEAAPAKRKKSAPSAPSAPAAAASRSSQTASAPTKSARPQPKQPDKAKAAAEAEDKESSPGFFKSLFGSVGPTPDRPDPKEPAVSRAPAKEPSVVEPALRKAPSTPQPKQANTAPAAQKAQPPKPAAPNPIVKPAQKAPAKPAPQTAPANAVPKAPQTETATQSPGFFGKLFGTAPANQPAAPAPATAKTAPAAAPKPAPQPAAKPQAQPQQPKAQPKQNAQPQQKAQPAQAPASSTGGGVLSIFPTKEPTAAEKAVAADKKFKIISDIPTADKPKKQPTKQTR